MRAAKKVQPEALTAFRDRVRGLAWLPRARIEEAAKNFRGHDDRQKRVIRGLLSELGVIDGLLVWVPDVEAREALRALPARDAVAFGSWLAGFAGAVRLIDGHARRSIINQETALVVTDLDEAEASKALATFDAVSDLAGADANMLAELLEDVSARDAGVLDLLGELQAYADTSAEPGAPGEKRESKAVEVDVEDEAVDFFLSARGPVVQQPEAIERLRAALAELEGVTVEVGIIGGRSR